MQRPGLASLRRLTSATPEARRAVLTDLRRQVREDARKAQWWMLRRRGGVVALASGRERFMVTVGEDAISQTVFVYGECDFQEVERVHELLGRPSGSRRFVDVGANIGSICVPAAARGWAAEVVAIEPDPWNHSLLQMNVTLNGLDSRVRVVHAAVGDGGTDHLELVLNDVNRGDHQIAITGGSPGTVVTVPAVTLDGLGLQLSADTDLVWMDIQGYEGYALAGATGIVSDRIPTVFEFWPAGLIRHGTTVTDLVGLLDPYEAWFDLSSPQPVARPLVELDQRAEELLARADGLYYTNVLVV